MSNFQPLEVVDRGSETQPQVVENLNGLSRIRDMLFIRTLIASSPCLW